MVRGGRRSGGRGQQGRDPCDIENKELRRQVQHLIERLESFEARSHEDDSSASNNDEKNPFHFRAPREELGGEARYHRQGQFDRFNGLNEGKIKAEEFVVWLNTVERVFDYKEIANHRKVKLVAIKLTKHASAWWEQLKMRRERMGKSRITIWDKMKKELRRKFLPDNYLQEWHSKLYNFPQGNKYVDEYTEEFDLLMIRCASMNQRSKLLLVT